MGGKVEVRERFTIALVAFGSHADDGWNFLTDLPSHLAESFMKFAIVVGFIVNGALIFNPALQARSRLLNDAREEGIEAILIRRIPQRGDGKFLVEIEYRYQTRSLTIYLRWYLVAFCASLEAGRL